MQYVSFDYLAWVLTAYFVICLLKSQDPRWWVAIGASIGFGTLSTYTIGFFALAIVAAVLPPGARRYLKSKWLWIAVAVSLLMFLPNLLWQVQHNFVSLDFLQHIHARDVRQAGPPTSFLSSWSSPLFAFRLPWSVFTSSLRATASAFACWAGCMYVVKLLVFTVAEGRGIT